MATSDVASSVLLNMGNGSGIDIIKLARDLADVEVMPQQDRVTRAKTDTEAAISAYAVLKYNVELLTEQFNGLNDAQELATPVAVSSNTSAISIGSTQGSAVSGSHQIDVTQLAASQRNRSSEYTSSTETLNSGSAFDITVTSNGSTQTISVDAGDDTPAGVVAAINASGTGFTATLIDTDTAGTNYRIVLQGPSGEDNAFTVSSTPDLGFHTAGNQLQSAANALLKVDGMSIERTSNTISDAISGVTLNLNAVASGTSLQVTNDTTTLKEKLKELVATYNVVQVVLNELSDPDSTEEEVGGALSNDMAFVRSVRDAIYAAVTTDSSTPSGDVSALRDLGIELTKTGSLSFNEATYDEVVLNNFSDVVTMLSAGTTNQSAYDGADQGLAFDSMEVINGLMDSIDGIFAVREDTATQQLRTYEDRLLAIELRMEKVYQSYLKQFSVMEDLVNTLNGTRDYVKQQLDSIANIGQDN
jgi:flagellar hook-associated protein 2